MTPENRNLILAVTLSMAVLIGWQLMVIQPEMEREQAQHALLVEELGHTQLLPEDAYGHVWGGSASVDNHQAENRMGSGADRLDAHVVRSGTPKEWIRMG